MFLQLTAAYVFICHGDVPFGEDQDAYLKASYEARLGLSYFDGQKNPLLPVFLSLVLPENQELWFTAARFWVAGLSIFLLILQIIKVRNLWGDGAAFLWWFLVGFNNVFLTYSSLVMVETLLVGFVGLFFLQFIEAIYQKQGWGWVGFWLGCAFLAKGTIPVLIGALCLALIVTRAFRELLKIGGVCFLVTSPFMIYKWVAFGSPWYQVSQGLSWRSFYHPHNLEGWTWQQFIADSGISGMFLRITENLIPSLGTAVSALSPISSSKTFSFVCLFVLLGLPLIIRKLKSSKLSESSHCLNLDKRLKALVIFWIFLWILFCTWMVPVANVPRYWIPLIPIIAAGIIGWWRMFLGKKNGLIFKNRALALLVLWIVFWFPVPQNFNKNYLLHPDLSWHQDEDYQSYQRIRKIVEGEKKSLKILNGPSKVLPLNWLMDFERITLKWSDQEDLQKVLDLFYESDLWVLDPQTRSKNGQFFNVLSSQLPFKNLPKCELVDRWKTSQGFVEVWKNLDL